MAFLLDTHALIWAVMDSPDLSKKARKCIINPENECLYSIVSLLEISIKHSLGSLEIKTSIEDFFQSIVNLGFAELPVLREHLLVLNKLEYIHKDPFDRLLISQSIYENLTFITKDAIIPKYQINILW